MRALSLALLLLAVLALSGVPDGGYDPLPLSSRGPGELVVVGADRAPSSLSVRPSATFEGYVIGSGFVSSRRYFRDGPLPLSIGGRWA